MWSRAHCSSRVAYAAAYKSEANRADPNHSCRALGGRTAVELEQKRIAKAACSAMALLLLLLLPLPQAVSVAGVHSGGWGSNFTAPGSAYSPFTIGQTLFDQVLQRLEERHDAVGRLGTDAAKWEARQATVRSKLNAMFEPLPSVSRPAKPRWVDRGVVPGSGYEIRKLLIETRPGYWASCGLWMPANASAGSNLPAVLHSSGHSSWAWREGSNQLMNYNLVMRGIAVLGYDVRELPHWCCCSLVPRNSATGRV